MQVAYCLDQAQQYLPNINQQQHMYSISRYQSKKKKDFGFDSNCKCSTSFMVMDLINPLLFQGVWTHFCYQFKCFL